eukprot:scaffold426899_cov19-Prasinocladus_malaysianus.AAC.1
MTLVPYQYEYQYGALRLAATRGTGCRCAYTRTRLLLHEWMDDAWTHVRYIVPSLGCCANVQRACKPRARAFPPICYRRTGLRCSLARFSKLVRIILPYGYRVQVLYSYE